MKYKQTRDYENMNRWSFAGVGAYGIPKIEPDFLKLSGSESEAWKEDLRFIGFHRAMSCRDPSGLGVHFFLDDYQFRRLWENPDRYVPILRRFSCVLSPDFSLYTDFPRALQIYNHYRKHWLGAYFQMQGIRVIPTICWSDRTSYAWCFDGEPRRSCVAVSAIGCQKSKEARKWFLEGYEEMQSRLEPARIIFYGAVPDECTGNILRISSFQEKFAKGEAEA